MQKILIGVTEFSRLTGIPTRTIYDWLKAQGGQLPSPILGSKPMKWLRSDVIKFFKLDKEV